MWLQCERWRLQVIQRAKEKWAEDKHWTTLSHRVEFAAGDFFKPGEQHAAVLAVLPGL